jgi:peptidoglycan/LPS O-acetylase OafA/YrhL
MTERASVAGEKAAFAKRILRRPSHAGSQFDALDGLRGMAAMLVVFAHMSRAGVNLHPALDFVEFGKPGVFLFFVLSSFLLTQQLIQRASGELLTLKVWTLYFLRRCLRIYPLFVVALLAGLSTPFMRMALFGPHDVSILDHLTLRQGVKIFWAIPVEVKFYVVLPLLVLAFAFVFRRNVTICSLTTVATIAMLEIFVPSSTMAYRSIDLGLYFPVFLCGFSAALLFEWCRTRELGTLARASLELMSLLAVAMVTLSLPAFYRLATGADVADYSMELRHVWYGAGWSLFLLGLLLSRGPVSRLLASGPARFVGLVSFSIYLWHLPIIEMVRRTVPVSPPLQALIIVTSLLPLATLSYLVVERPFIELGARISKREK